VLISAALSAQGAPAAVVRMALAQHRLVFSQPTFDELRTRLYRPKFDRYISLENRERLLHDFSACADWVEIAEPGRYCRDRDDDKFIETARTAGAAFLISGDKDLLEAVAPDGLQIITSVQAVEKLRV
jgi:putative PIN family toxin of toxin-antitoxin system